LAVRSRRKEWEAGGRAEFFYQQLDALCELRQAVRKDLLAERRKQSAAKLLRQVPSIGPIRAALLIALIQRLVVPELWTYSGLAIATRRQCAIPLRGRPAATFQETTATAWAQSTHNHDMKGIFESGEYGQQAAEAHKSPTF
jgi:hypothetical protein